MAKPKPKSLPFQEAIDFFKDKVRLPTEKWTDLWEGMHARGFVVAGVTRDDILADIQAAVVDGLENGSTLADFRKTFAAKILPKWTPPQDVGWRTRVIFETNIRMSYAAGRFKQAEELKATRPYLRYVAVMDGRTRPEHLAWHDTVLPIDDPWWKTHFPPQGFNCFPGDTLVRCEARVGLKAFYAGKMVQIETRGDKRLTVTANHPVLTGRGWVAAHCLKEGDQLIAATTGVDAALRGIVDHEKPPARADDLFEALATKGLRVVPMAPDDFDGDAFAMKGEIHVAGSDRALMDILQSSRGQFVGERRLATALHGRVESAGISEGAPFPDPIANKSGGTKDGGDRRARYAEMPGDRTRTYRTLPIEGQDLALDIGVARVGSNPGGAKQVGGLPSRLDADPSDTHRPGAIARLYPALSQDAPQRRPTEAGLHGQLLQANAGLVTPDEILLVREFDWSGHVYDFSTPSGLIVADGLIVSNCRCTVQSLSAEEVKRLGLEVAEEAPPVEMETKSVPGRGAVEVPKGIDPGFAYNVGEAAWGKQLAEDTMAAWRAQGALAYERLTPGDAASAGRPKNIPVDRPKVKLGPPAKNATQMMERVRDAIGGDAADIASPDGGAVHVDAEALASHVDPDRAPFVPFLKETIEEPSEIWLAFERHKGTGKVELRKRFVKSLDLGGKDRHMLVVAQARRGQLEAWTVLPVRQIGYLDAQRVGNLVYNR